MSISVKRLNLLLSLLFILFVAISFVSPAKPASSQTPSRPNIILIITDDQRWDTVSYMPIVESLAASGTTFTNAFMTTPLCCPSRSSILTGQYAHNHGVLTNAPGFYAFNDSSTLAVWLHDSGYKTALIGKYLNNYIAYTARPYIPPGWDWFQAFSTIPDYYDYSLTNFIGGINMTPMAYGSTTADYSTDVLATKASNFIKSTELNDAQPFFLYFSVNAPHAPSTPAQKYSTAFSDIASYRPPSFNEFDVRDKPSWIGSRLTQSEIATIDSTRKDYLRTLLSVDDAVAKIKDTLQTTGELNNTVIIFMGGDNGWHWGEHRINNGKQSPYEEAIRSTFIVFDGRNQIHQTNPSLVLNIDFAPTIMELAGLPVPATCDGASFVPLLRQQAVSWRSDFLVENWGDKNGGQFAELRSGDNKVYVEYADGGRELYDLTNDPYQLVNIISDPAQSSLIATMQARLQQLKPCVGASCR